MARTKNTSSFRNRGWTTTDPSENGKHSHTRVGKKFQYVTRAGERKNYMIRSYNPNSGKHIVQRINWRCDRRRHKPKEVLLETLLPNIRWVDNDKRWKEVKAAIAYEFYTTPNSYSNKPLEIINEIFFSKEVTQTHTHTHTHTHTQQPRKQKSKLERKRKRSRTIDSNLKAPVVGIGRTSTSTSTSTLPRAATNALVGVGVLSPRSNEEEVQQQILKRPRSDTTNVNVNVNVNGTSRVPLKNVDVVLPPPSSTDSSSLLSCASKKDGKSKNKADSLSVSPVLVTSQQRSGKASQEVAVAANQNTRKEPNQRGEKKACRKPISDQGKKQKDKNINDVSGVYSPRATSTLHASANTNSLQVEGSNTTTTIGSAKESVAVVVTSSVKKVESTRYIGVYFNGDGRRKLWQARCRGEYAVANNRKPYIGQYETAEEAARAFDEVLRQSGRVKDLADLNFPTSEEMERASIITKKKKRNFRGLTYYPNTPKPYMARCAKASVVANLGRCYARSFSNEIVAAKAWDDVLRQYGCPDDIQFLNFPTPEEMQTTGRDTTHAQSSQQNSNTPSPSTATDTASSVAARMTTLKPDSGRKSRAASAGKPLSGLVGNRIACEFGNGVYFGRIKDCGRAGRKCKVVFDDGEAYEVDYYEIRKCLVLYKKIIKEEVNSWKRGKESLSSLAVGDRIAFEFGNGVHFGSIQACNATNKPETKWTWTVLFDDGDRFEFDCSEMKKSMALCKKIRAKEKKNSSPTVKLGAEGSAITTTGGNKGRTCSDDNRNEKKKQISTKQLKKSKNSSPTMKPGTEGSAITTTTQETSTKSDDTKPIQTTLLDNGDVQKFDCKRTTEGLALFEELQEQDMNDPQQKEKLRKLESDFMTQKESVETKIPECAKKRFLTVGFATWESQYLPVLFLGPYDVSPGVVRDQWFHAFEKCTTNKNFPQIVYWFGSDFENGFSISTGNHCLSLMDGAKKGLLKQKSGNGPVSKTFNKALEKLFETQRKPLGPSRIPFKKLKEEHERICVPKIDCLVTEIEL